MPLKKILIGICITAVITIICLAVILPVYYNPTSSISQTYALGEATEKGNIGVELIYDNEIPDIVLKSPSGLVYTAQTADQYKIDEENNTITMLIDSGELGKWTISFNKMIQNNRISYKFINELSSTLYLMNTSITKTGEDYYVTFRPSQIVTSKNTCKYTLQLETNDMTYTLSNGTSTIGQQEFVSIAIPPEAYGNGEAVLKLTVKTSHKNPQIATETIRVNLIENAIDASDLMIQ